MKVLLKRGCARLPALLRAVGPMAAMELLLPGGSIIAILFWLHRHRTNIRAWTSNRAAPAYTAAARGASIAIPSHL